MSVHFLARLGPVVQPGMLEHLARAEERPVRIDREKPEGRGFKSRPVHQKSAVAAAEPEIRGSFQNNFLTVQSGPFTQPCHELFSVPTEMGGS